MFDLIHIAGVIRPAPDHQFVFLFDERMTEPVVRARFPDVKFVGTGKCTGRRLLFTRDGPTVIPRLGAQVHGTVWEMDVAALTELDATMVASGIRQRRSVFARMTEGLMLADIYTLRNPDPGDPDPALVLRVAELAVGLGFPGSYVKQIRSWLGASIH
jgi:gamma-glutamylcyclotransferase (GGCT)/AIG2-like uncharacterized protein YtfP